MKIDSLHQLFLKSSGICTDTRSIKKDCLFFALKGENFNGNKFTSEAIKKGAFKVIIDESQYQIPSGETILYEDVLTTLQELASFHRNYLNIPIIALTGSNGKTTTKELINCVLSKKYKTTATIGNLNNHIGVPLTILSMDSETEIGVVEMGANHLKEIELLASITQPNYGYITNFGKAHLEGFGGLEGVIQGKTELYRYLKEHNQSVFINANDIKQLKYSEEINKITFGDKNQDFQIELLAATNKLSVTFQDLTIQSHLIGIYNFNNIAAAIAIGSYLKVSNEDIKEAIEAYIPSNNRSQIIEKESNKIILDAYNANPSSMMAALENFIQYDGKNKLLFLGDMFELGSDSEKEHQHIVSFIEKNVEGVAYLIGENFYNTKTNASNIHKIEHFEALNSLLENQIFEEQYILIKASRGMALERILDIKCFN
ncbi:MAG: UDP-N-acetylmuramoyl-tripeptide--D-alanyl-D-alanine ligase [Flavobacteriaceae bacterium]|nr:UDP-N-acetylmuramoyl-tripeptide--D-alanyl-D-alanine ligase [Flavobacteriaceae bacterium]